MTETLPLRRDIDFLLHDWLGGFASVGRSEIDAFLDLSEALAEDTFLPHYKSSDIEEPYLGADGVVISPAVIAALDKYAEVGLFSAGFPEPLGGVGLPYLACAAGFSFFAAANIATAAYPMLTVANARLIATFGTDAQIEQFSRPQIAGRWFGTMCLSEPQAGSSLADVRTRAVAETADHYGERYRLRGNKMWISGGDQNASENIVHLVLAKIQTQTGLLPEGTGGISLFIVPKILPNGLRNDVSIAGVNHKMGYRGTANCLLNLGEQEGAVGWLVGEPGQGLRQMFMMMNEARIGVGIGAAALGYRGYRLSVRYARDRIQGRPRSQRDGAPVAIIRHPDVKRMLLQQKAYVEGGMALCLFCAKLVDDHDDEESAALLGLLTPVAKTWPSEFGLAANDIAIQIHGGYGYTRDFDVEQLWRDNRLNAIHEGTTGIQAIDLLGRKILRDGAGMPLLKKRIERTVAAAAAHSEFAPLGAALLAVGKQLDAAIARVAKADDDRALDNATSFLRAFGHFVVAWLWLDQALAVDKLSGTDEQTADFALGKRLACRFFFQSELPQADMLFAEVASLTSVAALADPSIFI